MDGMNENVLTTPDVAVSAAPAPPPGDDPPPWLSRFESDRKAAFELLRRGELERYAGKYVAFFFGRPAEADDRFDLAQKRAARRHDVPAESVFVMWIEAVAGGPVVPRVLAAVQEAFPENAPLANAQGRASDGIIQPVPIPDDELVWLQRMAADRDAAYEAWGRGELDEYQGRYVAFMNGKLVDVDEALAALYDRVGERFGIPAGTVYAFFVPR
jgi:hypothetical protein